MFDVRSSFRDTVDGLALHQEQQITSQYLDALREDKHHSLNPMNGDLARVASVPVAVVERWLREGFNIYQASAKDIVKRLRSEDLDDFITTKRSL